MVVEPGGKTCFEHTTYQPEERVRLRDQCGGAFATDACDDDNALGTCHLGDDSATIVYAGYQNLDGFIAVCKASGGSWDPS